MRLTKVLVESVLLYGAVHGMGRWRATWPSGEGASASSQDFIGGIWDAFFH